MQNGKVVPGVLLAILLAGGGWYWNHSKANIQSNAQEPHELDPNRKPGSDRKRGGSGNGVNRPVPVLAASVTTGDIRVVQTALGTVTPSAVVAVSSRVNGQLTRILFKEGQLVRAGELLAEIDPRPFQAALSQVQGQAMRNQALLRNSQIDLERYKTLQAQDSIASQQVDAQASLVQQYQGTVQADQGLVDNAKLQLSFTRITSPINGRIGLRQVDMGNNITTANTLAVVNTVDPIHVVFTLPEDRVSDLVKRFQSARKSGNNLLVEAWDRGNSNLLAKGNLLSLDNQIDTASGTVKLKARFSNKDSALFPNQFVNVRLLSNTLHNVTIVPNAAIQHGSAGAFVYRITHKQKDTTQKDAAKDAGGNTAPDTRVTVQAVHLGTIDGDYIEVIDGLKPDDQVIISGVDKLKENAKVIISRPEGKSGKRNHRDNLAASAKEHNGDNTTAPLNATSEDARPRQKRGDWTGKTSNDNLGDGTHQRPEGGWKRRNADQSSKTAAAEQ